MHLYTLLYGDCELWCDFDSTVLQANLDNLSNDWRTTINLEYKKTKEY